ncbi:hypothetical protein [Paludisphaera soli]|uniref:hypothetical protein n=1 Tax=Paludisphaera soli TaxID=2712865 RepID=UPI0013EDA39A|nr:hypothetical protein [Paludisphaera soli]
MRVASILCVLAAATASGCGDAASSRTVVPRDEKSIGAVGSQHALGADPKAEMVRLKKSAAAAGAPAPGQLPGR